MEKEVIIPITEKPKLDKRAEVIKILTDKNQIEQLKSFLDTIDFGVLRRKFKTLSQKCGLKKSSINLIEGDGIFVTKTRELGHILSDFNLLGINLDRINDWIYWIFTLEDENNAAPEAIPDVSIENIQAIAQLFIFIHEETHAIGFQRLFNWNPGRRSYKNEHTNFNEKSTLGAFEQQHSGYASMEFTTVSEDQITTRYNEFNEGITDMIAFEIMGEYIKETGAFDKKALELFSNMRNKLTAYGKFSQLVTLMMKVIANKTNLPTETVWRSIKRNYLEGVDFEDSEFAKLIDENTYQGFLTDLQNIQIDKIDITTGEVEGEAFHSCIQKLSRELPN